MTNEEMLNRSRPLMQDKKSSPVSSPTSARRLPEPPARPKTQQGDRQAIQPFPTESKRLQQRHP